MPKVLQESRKYNYYRRIGDDEAVYFYAGKTAKIPYAIVYNDDSDRGLIWEDASLFSVANIKTKTLQQSLRRGVYMGEQRQQILDFLRGDYPDPYHWQDLPEINVKTSLYGRAELYKYLTVDMSMSPATFAEHFGEAPAQMRGTEYERFHDAKVFFPDNIRPANKKRMLALLATFEQLLDTHNLGFLFDDSDIRFIKLSGNVIGLYRTASRDIAIQPSVKKSHEVIFTIIHEYGHKFWYEYMNETHHNHIKKMFEKIKTREKYQGRGQAQKKDYQDSIASNLKTGMQVTYLGRKKSFKKYSPFIIDSSSTPNKIRLVSTKAPDAGVIIDGPAAAFLNDKWDIEGIDLSVPDATDYVDSSDWFPTNYSMKNHEEWFCEIFSFYVNDKLQGQPKEWMAELIGMAQKNNA